MVDKYRHGVVKNVVHFRDISKIARVERTGGDPDEVTPTLTRLVQDKRYSIDNAFQDTVKAAYAVRDVSSRAEALTERLAGLKMRRIPADLRKQLTKLRDEIDRLIGDGDG